MTLTAFVAASTLVVIVYLIFSARRFHTTAQATGVSGVGDVIPGSPSYPGQALAPTTDAQIAQATKQQLKHRLVQAGMYKPGSDTLFVVARIIVAFIPLAVCVAAAGADWLPKTHAVLYGSLIGLFGTLVPSFWLDHLKRSRQTKIRKALPDALDVVAICLEGGLSLPGALARVGRELAEAHPLLAFELGIVEREIQMGCPVGDAMRQFAERFDMEELRSLASVISQTERFGASVAHALLVYADTMRLRRTQKAEEMAQKATVKILFPTLLCIFPGIFVVLLGPAAIQIYHAIIRQVWQR